MLFVQKWSFFQVSFLGTIGQENVFYDILQPESAILSCKNKKFRNTKNWHFSKPVNPWFWTKISPFSIISFRQYSQENVFFDILQHKNAFLGYKKKKFKMSKNWHFSKVVNPWFGSKNGHFCNFFFLGNIGQENVYYDILEQKNDFLGYKNKKFKKSKYLHFSKEVNPWF